MNEWAQLVLWVVGAGVVAPLGMFGLACLGWRIGAGLCPEQDGWGQGW